MSTIEARADDEHGLLRPWIALVDGKPLVNKLGAVRTFGTEAAALAAARKASGQKVERYMSPIPWIEEILQAKEAADGQ